MAFKDIPWGWHIGRAAAVFLPIAWLVFRLQLDLIGWAQANVDMANPIRCPARETALAVAAFPLFYIPGLLNWLRLVVGENALVVQMAANALCWECLLAPVVSRGFARVLLRVDALTEVARPGGGVLGLFGRRR
jgi:hypothetical protein